MVKRVCKSLLCVLALSVCLWAQMGGGHGGGMGGGHGFSGGHSGMSGGHGFAGHPGAGGSHPAGQLGHPGPFGGWHGNNWNNGWHGNWGWRGNGFHNAYWWGGRWRYPYWGYVGYYGYPGYGGYGAYGYSDYGDDYGSADYSPDMSTYSSYAPEYDVYANAPPPGYGSASASYASRDEVLQIQSEVRRLKAQQARISQTALATSNEPPTTLVYRDGRTEKVQNYAIAGRTLWILDQTHARKVPLANLDLPATQRQNEDRGVQFNVPQTQ